MVLRDHYFKLGSDVPEERIQGAVDLVKELNAENKTEEWDYALNRLIKGLNTSRQSARYGFSMALTEIIQELITKDDYDLTVSSYLQKVLEIIEVAKGKGKDERSSLFGRLFGFQTIINSQLLIEKYATKDDIFKLIDCFFELSVAKTWLRETSVFSLVQFIGNLQTNAHIEEIYDYILFQTKKFNLSLTSEGIAIYLVIPKIAENDWKNNYPLSKGNIPVLSKVLKESYEDSELKKGSWSPRLHFVWDLIISKLLNQRQSVEHVHKKRKTNKPEFVSLKEFWLSIVDNNFFSDKSSHERKYWGFELFEKLFSLVNEQQIEYIITPNFIRCLINQSSKNERMLNKKSVKVLNTIKSECLKTPNKSSFTINCLISSKNGGCWNFDLLTKSKTVESLINLKQDNLSVIELIKDVILNQFTESLTEGEALKKPEDNIQKWCLNSLLQLVKSNKPFIKKGTWIKDILDVMLLHSFFKGTLVVSTNTRNLCKERLNSILGEIISTKNNTSSWSLYCVEHIKSIDADLIDSFDEELNKIRTLCEEMLTTISELPESDKKYNFELLFSMVLLQIYNGDEDSFELVDELKVCYEKSMEQESDSSLILTEIILSLVSKKSSLLRKFSMIIWENLLCQKDEGALRLDEGCFELLFNVLETRENKEGQQSLFEGEGEFQEEGEDGSEGDDEEEEEDDDDDDEEEEEDDDDEEEEDDDMDETQDIDNQTNLKLAEALGIPHSGEVKFEDLSDDSSYESESMDDEQMMAMDDRLSKIFKERRDILSSAESGNKRKTDVLEAKENMIFFKNRIIDMLEIFVKHNESEMINFSMIKPLINLINLTLDKNLANKAQKLIKTRLSKTKVNQADDESIDELLQLIKWLHDLMNGKANTAAVQSSNQCSILISKNIINVKPQLIDEIMDIYSSSMKKWFKHKKSNIQPGLFFDFINWLNSIRGRA